MNVGGALQRLSSLYVLTSVRPDGKGDPSPQVPLPFVDGTTEISRLAGLPSCSDGAFFSAAHDGGVGPDVLTGTAALQPIGKSTELFEGALVGTTPYLFPIPVVALFASIFKFATSTPIADIQPPYT